MTSFTKALFRRNPGAAKELRRDQLTQLRYGRHVTLAQFTPEAHREAAEMPFGKRKAERMQELQRATGTGYKPDHPAFGKRVPTGLRACDRNCGQPACAQGCTLRAITAAVTPI